MQLQVLNVLNARCCVPHDEHETPIEALNAAAMQHSLFYTITTGAIKPDDDARNWMRQRISPHSSASHTAAWWPTYRYPWWLPRCMNDSDSICVSLIYRDHRCDVAKVRFPAEK